MATTSQPRPATTAPARNQKARPVTGWILLGLAPILGLIGAAVIFLLAAFFITSSILLRLLAVVSCFGISGWLAHRATRKIWPLSRYRFALGVGGGTTLVLALVAAFTVFSPLVPSSEYLPQAALPAKASYWNLSTGSRIAYLKLAAEGMPKDEPVIFLHGGPGAYAVAHPASVDYFGRLTRLGYEVYFYDQVGGGLSSRLEDVRQYSVERHVADLDAIISQQIKADKVILIGQSWGGTLAASYMAEHPQRVAKAVFSSPAPINYMEWPDYGNISDRLPTEVNREINQAFASPRLLFLIGMANINPRTARDFASDAELDTFFAQVISKMQPGMVCDPAHLPKGENINGFGFWASTMTQQQSPGNGKVNPREALATNPTPALVMTGECNYLKWAPTYQYRATLPNSTLLYFEKAGHVIYYDQPELYFEALSSFLQDHPLPLAPYQNSQPPEGVK
ncbi:MAG TPA: alpha/beta fold hydrolase [Chloroflexia bacterium]|nr:alpha/beta fold hydrolase [Chloroflexia bacterium]